MYSRQFNIYINSFSFMNIKQLFMWLTYLMTSIVFKHSLFWFALLCVFVCICVCVFFFFLLFIYFFFLSKLYDNNKYNVHIPWIYLSTKSNNWRLRLLNLLYQLPPGKGHRLKWSIMQNKGNFTYANIQHMYCIL